jgi:hypothetical protein
MWNNHDPARLRMGEFVVRTAYGCFDEAAFLKSLNNIPTVLQHCLSIS